MLLWIAVRRSARPADATHPLGYGPERYYWALLAAIGMFVVGGAVSIWHGIQALLDPPELEAFWVGVAVLLVALVLDALSRGVALRQLRTQAARRRLSVRELLRESADPILARTGVPSTYDAPRSSVASRPTHATYRTGSGRSSPTPVSVATTLPACSKA